MDTIVVGLNHKTASIAIREKFCLKPLERQLILSELKNNPAVAEAIVISTCNRTEIYANVLEGDAEILFQLFSKIKNLPVDLGLKKHFYTYRGRQAVEHLLRVSTGLDSLILGEKQVLGQIKEAAELSRQRGMMLKPFNILSNIAIRAGKKARSETQINCGGSSISWAAVAMAQNMLGTLQDKSVFVIGAGKMGHLAIGHLRNKGVECVYVTNRTHESAIALAEEFGGTAVSFWDMENILSKVDVCICSASAPHYIIEKDLVEKSLSTRRDRPLLLIDISMPRNIHPDVSSLEGVSLVAIDDLDKVIENNTKKRHAAVGQVEEIIRKKVSEFYLKLEKGEKMSSDCERVLEAGQGGRLPT